MQSLLFLGANAAGGVRGSVFDGTSWGSATTITGSAASRVVVAFVPGTGQGVGVVQGNDSTLGYTLWSASTWSSVQQLHADTTQGQPAVAAIGSAAHVVFWGQDFKYYYEAFSGGTWTAAAQAVLPAGTSMATQPCGPSAGALAALKAGPSLLFVNGTCSGTVNHLYETDLVSGSWTATTDLASDPSFSSMLRPAIVAPSSGPELLAVYVQQGGSQIEFAARTGGAWSSPAAITNALTNDPVALAPLAAGGALLAFRGTDGNLYTATYTGSAWTAPAAPFTPNVAVSTTPTATRGIGSASAELVYVDGSGAPFHTRLIGGSFTAPVAVASGLTTMTSISISGGP